MSTYIIGDVHGCFRTLERLLEAIAFEPGHDALYFVGDLVNTGPDSLSVLRLARELDAVVTLGNHDLHLLAVMYGERSLRSKDTFGDVLEAPDAEALRDWLRTRPLYVETPHFHMVHAGLFPSWSRSEARAAARLVEEGLRGEEPAALCSTMYGDEPRHASGVDSRASLQRFAINVFTRMRALRRDDLALEFKFKSTLEELPEGLTPWFEIAHERDGAPLLCFGHWSALGVHRAERTSSLCLDSGCVWGNALTAYAVESKRLYTVPTQPGESASF